MYKEIDFKQSFFEKKSPMVYILLGLLTLFVVAESGVLAYYIFYAPNQDIFRAGIYIFTHLFMVILAFLMVFNTKKTVEWEKGMMVYLLVEAALVIIMVRDAYLFYMPTFAVELGLLLLIRFNNKTNKTLNATAMIIFSFVILGGTRLGYIFAEISNDVLIGENADIGGIYLWTIFHVGYMVFPVLMHFLIYSATPLPEDFVESPKEAQTI